MTLIAWKKPENWKSKNTFEHKNRLLRILPRLKLAKNLQIRRSFPNCENQAQYWLEFYKFFSKMLIIVNFILVYKAAK